MHINNILEYFLVSLRANKYEAYHESLFGFDFYVDSDEFLLRLFCD